MCGQTSQDGQGAERDSLAHAPLTPRSDTGEPPAALTIRVISALVLVPVALGVVWLGGLALAGFVALALLLLIGEWMRLVRMPLVSLEAALLAVTGLGVCALTAFDAGGEGARLSLLVLSIGATLAGLAALRSGRDGFYVLFAGPYLLLPALSFLWVRQGADGLQWTLWLFVVVWTTDTGAYLFGRLIGGPAFAPNSSPNKTWAGLIGGIVLAAVLGGAGAVWLFDVAPDPASLRRWVLLAVVISVVTQAGDIFESGLKRHFRVKDTGRLIPGHGGLLDRLDGFLFAVMMVALIRVLG